MLNVYYCPCCDRFTYLQYNINTYCRSCETDMYKLSLSFIQFTKLDEEQRYEYFITEYIESDYYHKIFEEKKRREEIVKAKLRRVNDKSDRKKRDRLFIDSEDKYHL